MCTEDATGTNDAAWQFYKQKKKKKYAVRVGIQTLCGKIIPL